MNLTKTIGLFFTSLIFVLQVHAIEESQIQNVMETKVNKVIDVLKEKNKDNTQKANMIFSIMDEFFDYTVMSKISLGREWKNLSDAQRNDFVKLFEKKLKNSYLDKLNLYTDQKIEFNGLKKLNEKRIVLLSKIIGKDETFDIEYKFYKNLKNDWLIYDVSIIGVSLMQTYRQQFSGFLQTNSMDELLTELSQKN